MSGRPLRAASNGVLAGGEADTLILCHASLHMTSRAPAPRTVNDTIEAGRSPRS